jgi:hypothetical protein
MVCICGCMFMIKRLKRSTYPDLHVFTLVGIKYLHVTNYLFGFCIIGWHFLINIILMVCCE